VRDVLVVPEPGVLVTCGADSRIAVWDYTVVNDADGLDGAAAADAGDGDGDGDGAAARSPRAAAAGNTSCGAPAAGGRDGYVSEWRREQAREKARRVVVVAAGAERC